MVGSHILRKWIALSAFACVAATAQDLPQSVDVDVPHVHMHVWYMFNYEAEPMLIENFSTNDPRNHSVYCISGLRGVQYELRDAFGNVVPARAEPWKHASDLVNGEGGVVPGAPDPCKTVESDFDQRRVLLYYLYPGLPRGKYTLRLTLAPQRSNESATSAPLTIIRNDALPTWSLSTTAEEDAAQRTMSLPHLRLEISLGHNGQEDAVLFEGFHTDDPIHYSVYCRTASLDVQYELRGASGNIIPMRRPWEPGTEVVLDSGAGYVPDWPDPCKTAMSAKNERKVLLRGLYPGLPHGAYTLKVTLTPRGGRDSAASEPFPVRM